jgi:hypothetical protein
MTDWIDFDRWPECRDLERPGIVFEVENAEGQSLLTTCTIPLEVPFDWTGGPIRFRPIEEPKPQHSAPLPAPAR